MRPCRPLYLLATMPSRYAVTPAMSMPLEGGGDAVLGGLAGDVGDLGRVQQRLGRDAADVQAGAAELVLLDQADGEAELAGAQCGGVATASAAEDDKVKVLLGHPATPLCVQDCVSDRSAGWRAAAVMRQGFPCRKRPYYGREKSSASASRVRTATPVGPLPVNRSRRPVVGGAGDVEVRPRDRGASVALAGRADELLQEDAGEQHPAGRVAGLRVGDVGDVGVEHGAQLGGQRHRPERSRRRRRRRRSTRRDELVVAHDRGRSGCRGRPVRRRSASRRRRSRRGAPRSRRRGRRPARGGPRRRC